MALSISSSLAELIGPNKEKDCLAIKIKRKLIVVLQMSILYEYQSSNVILAKMHVAALRFLKVYKNCFTCQCRRRQTGAEVVPAEKHTFT